MAKKKPPKPPTDKVKRRPPPKGDRLAVDANVPCLHVKVGGQGATGGSHRGCRVVNDKLQATSKFDLRRDFRATSANVTRKKRGNEPCRGSLKRAGCPVQIAFDKGQPFLRFCLKDKEPGYRVDVNTPAEAQAKAKEICDQWAANDRKFPSMDVPLMGRRR